MLLKVDILRNREILIVQPHLMKLKEKHGKKQCCMEVVRGWKGVTGGVTSVLP